MVILITGPAGVGKTTVGGALAADLGWAFVDADDFHSATAIASMRRGIGLTEDERRPWLSRVRARIDAAVAGSRNLVVACSALRAEHRDILTGGVPDVHLVHLNGPRALLESRLSRRGGHFAAANLLQSQLEALEPPERALILDAALPVEGLVARIRASLRS